MFQSSGTDSSAVKQGYLHQKNIPSTSVFQEHRVSLDLNMCGAKAVSVLWHGFICSKTRVPSPKEYPINLYATHKSWTWLLRGLSHECCLQTSQEYIMHMYQNCSGAKLIMSLNHNSESSYCIHIAQAPIVVHVVVQDGLNAKRSRTLHFSYLC